MTSRARQTFPVGRDDPEELTGHLNVETISRLKAACVEEPSVPASLESEETFGMVCELSSSSTARVYLAVDRRTQTGERVVAVKRFSAGLTKQKNFAEIFIEEMQLAASVVHPAVCRVRDFGRAGLSYYLATEFLQGETLDSVLHAASARATSARPPRVIASVFAQLAEGLHALHTSLSDDEGSVAHGDLSARNLFVLFDGTVRVADFGTAWARDELKRTRRQDAIDHSYLAPELLQRGKRVTPDAQSDVWALGVVLWELLAGRRLFRCPSEREAVVQISARRIAPPSEHHPQVSAELDRIVLKALSRSRGKRYASAHELGEDLERYLEDAPMPKQAEIAAWLDAVFPSGAERARGIVELANVTAARLQAPDSFEAPPTSGAYVPASQDEPEHTTQIFAPSLSRTLRSLDAPPLTMSDPLPVEPTVSFKDVPTTVRRPRRLQGQSTWRAALVPFAMTFSFALGVLGIGQTLLARHASAPVATAPVLARQAAPTAAALQTRPAVAAPAPPKPSVSEPAPRVEPVPEAEPKKPSTAVHAAQSSAPSSKPSPSKPPPASGIQAQPGAVFVTTPGGGDIYDKGSYLGHAPGEVQLSPGWHTLVIKSGSENRAVSVQVPAGSAIMVSVPANK